MDERTELVIHTDITLEKDSKRLEFRTTLNNVCRDHLFTVSFPSSIAAEEADWEAPSRFVGGRWTGLPMII